MQFAALPCTLLCRVRGGAGENPQSLMDAWVAAKRADLDAVEDVRDAYEDGDSTAFAKAVAAQTNCQQATTAAWKALVAAGVFPQQQQSQPRAA